MLRLGLFVLLMLGAVGAVADACPPGPCNKYRRAPQVITAQPTGYVRQLPARMPRLTRANIVALLTASAWDPVFSIAPMLHDVHIVPPPRIRFVEASRARRATPGLANVLLRRIELRGGVAMVDVDGGIFVLERCADARSRVCLTARDDLSWEAPVVEQTQFAQPPPS